MKDFNLLALLLNPEFSAMLMQGLKMTLVIAAGSWPLSTSAPTCGAER